MKVTISPQLCQHRVLLDFCVQYVIKMQSQFWVVYLIIGEIELLFKCLKAEGRIFKSVWLTPFPPDPIPPSHHRAQTGLPELHSSFWSEVFIKQCIVGLSSFYLKNKSVWLIYWTSRKYFGGSREIKDGKFQIIWTFLTIKSLLKTINVSQNYWVPPQSSATLNISHYITFSLAPNRV